MKPTKVSFYGIIFWVSCGCVWWLVRGTCVVYDPSCASVFGYHVDVFGGSFEGPVWFTILHVHQFLGIMWMCLVARSRDLCGLRSFMCISFWVSCGCVWWLVRGTCVVYDPSCASVFGYHVDVFGGSFEGPVWFTILHVHQFLGIMWMCLVARSRDLCGLRSFMCISFWVSCGCVWWLVQGTCVVYDPSCASVFGYHVDVFGGSFEGPVWFTILHVHQFLGIMWMCLVARSRDLCGLRSFMCISFWVSCGCFWWLVRGTCVVYDPSCASVFGYHVDVFGGSFKGPVWFTILHVHQFLGIMWMCLVARSRDLCGLRSFMCGEHTEEVADLGVVHPSCPILIHFFFIFTQFWA